MLFARESLELPTSQLASTSFPLCPQQRTFVSAVGTSVECRYCCKSHRDEAVEYKRATIESRRNGFLDQRCAYAPDIESILLAKMRKIFLQQYLPQADISQ